jgi:hypothetical protein
MQKRAEKGADNPRVQATEPKIIPSDATPFHGVDNDCRACTKESGSLRSTPLRNTVFRLFVVSTASCANC